MRAVDYVLILALAFIVLVGCAKVPEIQVESVPAGGPAASTGIRGTERVTQLALGTLQLEGTANAVTAEQAAALSPLWEMLQSGELQGGTEQNGQIQCHGRLSQT